jgi:ribosome maturation factor RimP
VHKREDELKEKYMNKKSIEETVTDIVNNIIKSTDYELVDVEYVKEGPFKYLKVYINKEEGITVDDCADISRALNKKLDDIDFIKEQYFLEVSSPGVERPLKTEADFAKNLDKLVEVKFYKPIDGKKMVTGILLEKTETAVVINAENEKISIDLKDISKINRAIEDF